MNMLFKIGGPAVLEQTAEECAEMAKAALKLARKMRGENPTPKTEEELRAHLNEEIADVKVCIRALLNGGVIDSHLITLIMREKQERWENRLAEDGK